MTAPGIAVNCFAKVNLTLEITGRRPDGYHDLCSLVHTIAIADHLVLAAARDLVCETIGSHLSQEDNLAWRAARLLQQTCGVSSGAHMRLRKRIPVAAGLGGGSADAAGALVALNRLWKSNLPDADLHRLASSLGSDVPFLLHGGAAIVRGRGDLLEQVQPMDAWLVLVVPEHHLARKTAILYASVNENDFSDGAFAARAARHLQSGAPPGEAPLCNAFERAAREIFTGLASLWDTVQDRTQRRFHLSGAGPSLFTLTSTRAEARGIVPHLRGIPAVVRISRLQAPGHAAMSYP